MEKQQGSKAIYGLSEEDGLPTWASGRPGWNYAGWISRDPFYRSFDEHVKRSKISDHGELRKVDIYPEGAVCWWKEAVRVYTQKE